MNQFLEEVTIARRMHLYELAKIALLDEILRLPTSLQLGRGVHPKHLFLS